MNSQNIKENAASLYVGGLIGLFIIGFFASVYISLSPGYVAERFDPMDIKSPVLVDKEVYQPGELVTGQFRLLRRTGESSTLYRNISCDTGHYPLDPVRIPGRDLQGRQELEVEVIAAITTLTDRGGKPIKPGECRFRFVSEFHLIFGGETFKYTESYETVVFTVSGQPVTP